MATPYNTLATKWTEYEYRLKQQHSTAELETLLPMLKQAFYAGIHCIVMGYDDDIREGTRDFMKGCAYELGCYYGERERNTGVPTTLP